MSATVLTLSWSTSRGQDTYGYNIARLDDTSTGKRYRCMGGGYDMVGTVFADWLQETHQTELQLICGRAASRVEENGLVRSDHPHTLYGMTEGRDGEILLDGACGLESIRRVAEAIGLSVRTLSNRRGHATGFVVEVAQ